VSEQTKRRRGVCVVHVLGWAFVHRRLSQGAEERVTETDELRANGREKEGKSEKERKGEREKIGRGSKANFHTPPLNAYGIRMAHTYIQGSSLPSRLSYHVRTNESNLCEKGLSSVWLLSLCFNHGAIYYNFAQGCLLSLSSIPTGGRGAPR